MKKAIVILSGGLDSTTCLALAKSKGYDCYAMTFSYGQKHGAEINAAIRVAQHFEVAQHEIVPLPPLSFQGSALTESDIDVPDFIGSEDIPSTYVPARNTIFLSMALGWAEVVGAKAIYIGVSAIDYSGYPDCRPDFIAAFEKMANLSTKSGREGRGVTIETPLMYLSKSDTIQLGQQLGVDHAHTVSCYRATHEGLACGTCDSCIYRKKGFLEANVLDPTGYILDSLK